MIDPMANCFTCKHLDREKTNENWVVCPIMPVDVALKGASDDCQKYERDEMQTS